MHQVNQRNVFDTEGDNDIAGNLKYTSLWAFGPKISSHFLKHNGVIKNY